MPNYVTVTNLFNRPELKWICGLFADTLEAVDKSISVISCNRDDNTN